MDYSTRELYLAIYLMSLGRKVQLQAHGVGNNRFTFFFDRTDDLESIISDYWQGQARVEPTHFVACMKQLRARMHNATE